MHEIPVCYGGAAGIDLAELAAERGMSPEAFAERHASVEYRVAFLGFSPGFAYLAGLPGALAAPRLPAPRVHVPWGSVAIGGPYTGIYPDSGPGGWRLIGRSPSPLFDARRDPPAVLAPGDRIRFVAIEEWKFAAIAASRGLRA
jgi:KipI family sensor histidine kinase inhibitor